MTPSPDLTALVAGIRHDPANDLRRLVVADWIEEHGQPARGEYIRLAVALAGEYQRCGEDGGRVPPRPACLCPACVAGHRFRDLDDVFADAWEHELREPAIHRHLGDDTPQTRNYLRVAFRWHLGFVAGVRCQLRWWLDWGPRVCRLHPVEDVRVTDQEPFAEADPPEADGEPRFFWSSMPPSTRPHRYRRGALPALLWHSPHVCRFDPGDPLAVPPVPARMLPIRFTEQSHAFRALSRAAVEWAASSAESGTPADVSDDE